MRRNSRRSGMGVAERVISACVVLVVLIAAQPAARGQAAPGSDRQLQRVTLQLKWYHQFQFAGYYAAIEKGYFKEAGLDVVLKEGTPGMDPAKVVASGEADYGITGSDVLLHRAEGEPIVVAAAIFQHSADVLMTLRSSGFRTPQDLRGKRVMLTPATDPEILSMFLNEGVNPKQIMIVPHTWNLDGLLSGNVDAVSGYITNEPFLARQRGVDLALINPMTYGIDFYGDCLFTSEREAAAHPERVAAFLSATRQGWLYAMSHKEETVDLILKRYSPYKSREHLLYEASAMEKLILPDLVEIGLMNPWRWRHIAEEYSRLGLLPPGYSIDGLLFAPPVPWAQRYSQPLAFGIAAFIGLGLLVVLALVTFNRRLKIAVASQTAQLRENEQRLESIAQQADAANQAKDRFLATLSHELRTPLTPVLALLSSIAHDSNVPEDLLPDIRTMRHNVELEARLIDDLLDLTRIIHGRLTLELQPVDAHDMLRRALNISESDALRKQLKLCVNLAARQHYINGDPARIQQVFWNMIKNAVRYTPESGTITVETHNGPEGPNSTDRLIVKVTDTGVGIAPEVLPYVFRAFENAASLPARQIGGLGLGMTIARSVIEMHRGSICVASAGRGQGTSFTVTLPTIPLPAAALAPPQPAGPHSGTSRKLRILLVEDHAATLMVMARLLRGMGHEVVTATTVQSAIAEGLRGSFDLLLSDLGLPDGTGHQVIAQMRHQQQLHAIALSGYGMETDVEESRRAGFAAHLTKPVDVQTLRSTIDTICAQEVPAPENLATSRSGDGA